VTTRNHTSEDANVEIAGKEAINSEESFNKNVESLHLLDSK
jgi:hypothetical protein